MFDSLLRVSLLVMEKCQKEQNVLLVKNNSEQVKMNILQLFKETFFLSKVLIITEQPDPATQVNADLQPLHKVPATGNHG